MFVHITEHSHSLALDVDPVVACRRPWVSPLHVGAGFLKTWSEAFMKLHHLQQVSIVGHIKHDNNNSNLFSH